MWSDLLFRLRAILRRNAVEGELNDELQFHREEQINAYERAGLTRDAALRRTRLSFGGLDQIKEECRGARGTVLIDTTLQDLRYAIRGMRRAPLFTAVALVTLAVTTGTVDAVFSLANTFFFRRLPADRPEQLVAVTPTRRHGAKLGWISYPDYTHFRDHAKTLQGLAAHYSSAPLFVSLNNSAREINGAVVSANFFSLLGLRPALGRFFTTEEDSVPDRDYVAVLSYDFWRQRFGFSPAALGATIRINGKPFTVIGVVSAGFRGMLESPSEIYIPTMMLHVGYQYCDGVRDENCTVLSMVGRLMPQKGIEATKAEMETLVPSRWAKASEGDNTGVTVFPARGVDYHDYDSYSRLVRLLLLAAGVLLVVCCANLAGLLTARAAAREREIAIRVSLGATRFRLVRQLITESILLAAMGGVPGILVSVGLTRTIGSIFYSTDSEGHPLHYNFSPGLGVFTAALSVSIAAGFLLGLVPAVLSSRRAPAERLKGNIAALTTRPQLTQWLVGTQAAFAMALLAVSTLLILSTQILLRGVSFEPSHIALMRLRPRLIGYSPSRAQQFLRKAIQRLESTPGVESASIIGTGAVLRGGEAEVSLPEWPDADRLGAVAGYSDIGPQYFATLRTPVILGREFDDRDNLNSPLVAIVNQTLARRLWRTGDVVGKTIRVGHRIYRVIGLVEDVRLQTRAETVEPHVYVAYWQNPVAVDSRLCVRVRGDPAAMLSMLIREVNGVDRDVPIAETITLPLQLDGLFQPLRMSAAFVTYIAGLAVLLSAMGLYGALTFAVSRRTKEIGIRMAFGAKSHEIRAMILREGMTVIFIAIFAGFGMAAVGERLVHHLLIGAASGDILFYGGAAGLVVCTGILACWVPARRAAKIEPSSALRDG